MLNYGAPSWFYRENTESAKHTVVRELLLEQCCDGLFAIISFMYVDVSVTSYIAESVASWEKESGSVAKLRASNIGFIQFGYYAILK